VWLKGRHDQEAAALIHPDLSDRDLSHGHSKLPNDLALTCGAKRRQVQRLVGQRPHVAGIMDSQLRHAQPFWHLTEFAVASWHTGYSAWQYCAQTASERDSPTDENPLAPPSSTTMYDGQSVGLLTVPPQLTAAPKEHQSARKLRARPLLVPFIFTTPITDSPVCPTIVALTCGAKRRQVQRLVGQLHRGRSLLIRHAQPF
jgi:hypothetical protein